ncbi:MAG TPA: YIP1 family protein [Pyrinomonadaceae bacterium]|nr:YIP1 family protein [Pyrinomonadaceae bacterium]
MSALPESNFEAPPPPPTPPVETKGPRATHLWPYAVGSFVLGLIVLGGWMAKLIPRGWSTAASLCFLGVLLGAFGFIRLPLVPKKEEPLSLLDRVTGIFFEPSRVFRNLREYPRWVGAFLMIGVLTVIYSVAFVQRITPERIVDHTSEKMAEMGAFAPPPEAREQIKADSLEALKNPVQRAAGYVNTFVGLFAVSSIVAALSLLGILAFGGRINFWQALSVTFWSALPVVVIQKLLGLVILYLKSPDDLHPILNQETTLQDNLGILFSPADHPILFVLASFIGLTSFYGLWLRGKGLHLGATRASSGAGWGVAIMLWILLLIVVVIFTALFPGFIG